MAIPDGRCQRCLIALDPASTFMADRDRVCDVCAERAAKRGEKVVPLERESAPPAA